VGILKHNRNNFSNKKKTRGRDKNANSESKSNCVQVNIVTSARRGEARRASGAGV